VELWLTRFIALIMLALCLSVSVFVGRTRSPVQWASEATDKVGPSWSRPTGWSSKGWRAALNGAKLFLSYYVGAHPLGRCLRPHLAGLLEGKGALGRLWGPLAARCFCCLASSMISWRKQKLTRQTDAPHFHPARWQPHASRAPNPSHHNGAQQ